MDKLDPPLGLMLLGGPSMLLSTVAFLSFRAEDCSILGPFERKRADRV